jgi:hypothetical protein
MQFFGLLWYKKLFTYRIEIFQFFFLDMILHRRFRSKESLNSASLVHRQILLMLVPDFWGFDISPPTL